MANKRIYYAIQQVSIGDMSGSAAANGNIFQAVHGLQSVGISTNFNLEQVFELGQLEIYQNIEDVPEVEVTLNKVLDGHKLVYELATENGTELGATPAAAAALRKTSDTLSGRQNARCDLYLGIYPDTNDAVTGSATQTVKCEGMYVSSVSYTFPVDGNFTEDVTLVGNSKIWGGTALVADGDLTTNADVPDDNIGRRQYLDMANCFFPRDIPGVNTATGKLTDNGASGEGWSAHFQNITVSCDLGRESINELGRFAPYHRYATFPVEVTSEFEVLSTTGDGVNAAEEGYYTGSAAYNATPSLNTGVAQCDSAFNLLESKILIVTCEGTAIDLGTRNKLTSINYSGGDTGGGNVTVTYSYSTYNTFTLSSNHTV
jgi:hypothetical protein